LDEVEPELERAAKAGARLICRDDEEYPALLKLIPDPPPLLYVIGKIEPRDLNGIAIVGSRRCSFYGREQAERFSALLAGAGFTVVSGGARGIDSAAHRGAMTHESGRTIAVLGSGIDVPYPRENESLFRQIAERGAVVSEYPMGTAPLAENFPKRNRIVSGMTRGVLVVESDERSGALITARMAAEDHNRAVMAIPGRVDNAMAAGPHKLIREGAALVANLEDIVNALHPLPQEVGQADLFVPAQEEEGTKQQAVVEPLLANLSDQQKLLVDAINDHPSDVDSIVERSGLSAPIVLQQLTMLSLKGIVKRVDGNTYIRKK
jgi:DNA processing protein